MSDENSSTTNDSHTDANAAVENGSTTGAQNSHSQQGDENTSTPGSGQSDNNNNSNQNNPTQDPLAAAQQHATEMEELAKRTLADLHNFKRRADEERSELILYANLQFLQTIFPVIDNFQRAFYHLPQDLTENEWIKGVQSIQKQFIEAMKAIGVEEIPCESGSKFDPNLHEAIMQGPGEKDSVLECFEKGYIFKGKTVRPAKVKVGDGS